MACLNGARKLIFGFAVCAWLGGASLAFAQPPETPPDDTTREQELLVPADPDAKGEVDRDDATARLQWQRLAWGTVTPTFRQNALRAGRDHSNGKYADGPRWFSIGPNGAEYAQNGSFTGQVRDAGRARTILFHPTNPNIVYFLSSGGGLWRTDNWNAAQTSWRSLTDDLPTTGGGSVAFGRNPNTLYLGLGDPYDQILVGGAVTKSSNGGVTWSGVVELGSAVSVRDVQVDTSTNREVVLVATDNGLYRSADEGATYNPVPYFAGQSVWSIARTSAGWLVSAQPCNAANVGLQCSFATTLSLSTDRGATWAPISNNGNVFSSNGRTTLGVAVPGDAVVYAYSSSVGDGFMRDVYRSTDGGQTWVANGVNSSKSPTNPVPAMPNMNICQSQCWYNQMVLVDPRDPNRTTVWIGGNLASAVSLDGGNTWTLKTWWLPGQVPSLPYAHADFHAAAFKTTGTPTLILGTDGGMNISVDDGATFSSDKNTGMANHLFYTVAGNARFPSLVIGGTQDNGTRLRTDGRNIYNQVIGGDGMGTAYSADNTNSVLGSAQGSSMRTNLSNTPPEVFQNWAGATSGLGDSAGFGFFTAIVPAPPGLDPTGRVFFHFSGSRVWRSNTGGLSWTRIASATAPPSPGLPSNRRFRSSPYNLGVSPTDLNRIAVGAAGGFVDITTDGGATWTDVNLIAAVPGYQGFVTNVTWQDSQTIWVTSVAQAPGAVRVIRGTIGSPTDSWATATWVAMQNGLPDLPITRVYFDPRDPARRTILAATHVGVYRTTDGGANWVSYSNGLPTVRVNDIYMPPDGGFIRVATYGRGIWEMPQVELVKTWLTDGPTACDRDGVLDEGESGFLNVTLKNQGAFNVNTVELALTSNNPHLVFTNGNVVSFPPIPAGQESTAAIRVSLNGASGIETADIRIEVIAPELQLASGLSVVATHRMNYDERAAASSVETVEPISTAWTIGGGTPVAPNIAAWQRRSLSPTRHVWWGPDNNGQRDDLRPDGPDEQYLVSPELVVGTGPLGITFSHRFSFESTGWDGGVIELSTDGGANWVDIGGSAYNGTTNAVTSAPIGASRPAFVNRITGWPNFSNVALNLGTTYSGQTVRIRFRIGADESTGAPGWDIDDIAVSGLSNLPFGALVPNAAVCTTTQAQ